MGWFTSVIAVMVAVCCFVQSADAKQRIVTKVKGGGPVSIAKQLQMQQQQLLQEQMQAEMQMQISQQQAQVQMQAPSREYMPTPTQQANMTFERARRKTVFVVPTNPGPPGFHFGR